MTMQLRAACVVAVCAPLWLVIAGILSVAAGERMGATPFAGTVPGNSAEAAAMGRAADVLRFLRAGEDPRRVYSVDPEIISSAVRQATTLEAAVWSRQVALIQLLDAEGAVSAGAERESLACLAADLEAADIAAYLAPGGTGHCEPGQAYARVLARTTSGQR
jgi:hypothetical protein